ncbi:MAG: hypothetical protein AB7O66_02615 [Limisphaerales bacterium]
MHPAAPVSVVTPVAHAFDWTKRVLFQPFDLYRWLVVGFTAWLATLGEQWAGGNVGGRQTGGNPDWQPQAVWDETRTYVADNLPWLVPVVILAVLLLVALGLVVIWLSSRGRFMFLHNVALNQAEVVAPWHRYRQHGNSLFLFRIVVALVAFLLAIPLLAIAVAASIPMFRDQMFAPIPLIILVVAMLGLFVVGVGVALVEKFTKDFVVPIMALRQPSCRLAWNEFGGLLRSSPGNFALYILFQILLSLATAVLVLVVVALTCCIAGCLLALPYLGTVFLLPILVFFRSYSLLYFAQYGPAYNVFASEPSGPSHPSTDSPLPPR